MYLPEEEISLYEKAEKLINKRINEFNQKTESKNIGATLFLKVIVLQFAIELLKLEELKTKSEDRIKDLNSQIEDINSQIENYLSKETA